MQKKLEPDNTKDESKLRDIDPMLDVKVTLKSGITLSGKMDNDLLRDMSSKVILQLKSGNRAVLDRNRIDNIAVVGTSHDA